MSPTVPPSRLRAAGFCALVFALAFGAYWPALRGSMLWDDGAYMTRQELQSGHGFWRIWTEMGATEQYYPLLHGAFWAEHRLWGDATPGYHVLNVALHAASACLFALVLLRLGVRGAGLAGLIFALHPVCVESVAWITEQKNTLSTVLYLLSLLAYLRFDRERSPRWYGGALGLFCLALMAKTVTATLPAALLLILWWQRGRLEWRRDARPLVPWLALGAAAGLFSGWVERTYVGARGAAYALGGIGRTLVAARASWFYLGKLLWPTHLMFMYPRWVIRAEDPGSWAAPVLLLLALAALAAWALRRRDQAWARGVLVAVLFFLGSLFPTLGFLNVYAFLFSYVADHWQYLPSLGIIALAGAAWSRYTRESRALACAVVAVLGVLTWRQARLYRDAPTLYREMLARNPSAWRLRAEWADIMMAQGRYAEAAAFYERVLADAPDYAESRNHLGDAYLKLGRIPDARAQLEAAVRLRPDATDARVNLGSVLAQLGRLPEAIAQFQAALQWDPKAAGTHNNLGNALAQAGRLPEATAEYREAVRLQPDFADAHVNLANALTQAGSIPEALRHYEIALRLDPRSAEGRYNYALALIQAGRPAEAAGQLAQASELAPGSAVIWGRRGVLLAQGRRFSEAEAALRQAQRLSPGSAEAEANLGLVLLQEGKAGEAADHLQNALNLDPGLAGLRPSLARARQLAPR